MDSKKDIGRFFKDSLEQLDYTPSENLWSNIEENLKARKKKKRSIIIFRSILLSGVLFGFFMIYFYQSYSIEIILEKKNDISTQQVEKVQILEKKNTISQNRLLLNNNNEIHSYYQSGLIQSRLEQLNKIIDNLNQEAFYTLGLLSNNANNENRLIINEEFELIKSNNLSVTFSDLLNRVYANTRYSFNQKTVSNSQHNKKLSLPILQSFQNTKGFILNKNVNQVVKNISSNDNNSNEKDTGDFVHVSLKSSRQYLTAINLNAKGIKLDSLRNNLDFMKLFKKQKKEESKEEKEDKFLKNVYVGVDFGFNVSRKLGTDIKFLTNQNAFKKSNIITTSYGINILKMTSKKSGFKTGVRVLKNSNEYKGVKNNNFFLRSDAFKSNTSIGNVNTLYSEGDEVVLKTNVDYVDIPLEYYHVWKEGKIGISSSVGLSALFLYNNDVTLTSKSSGTLSLGEINDLSKANLSFNICGNLFYNITPNVKIHLSPSIRTQIFDTTRETSKFRVYTGLQLGLLFKL